MDTGSSGCGGADLGSSGSGELAAGQVVTIFDNQGWGIALRLCDYQSRSVFYGCGMPIGASIESRSQAGVNH